MIESPFVTLIVKLILLAVLLGFAGKSLRDTWRELQSDKWPMARAQALLSRVVEAPLGQRRGFLGSHSWQVKWRYQVKGKSYTSAVMQPFPPTTEGNAQMMASRIEKGDTFDVRYDPSKPSVSRLALNATNAKVQLALRVFVYTLGIGVSIWAMIYL